MYAGTAPGGLFKSEDWGATWQGIDAFNGHENRALWQGIPGGQSPVHSIIIDPADPKHMYLSSSGGGSYVTLDGGERWVMFSHHAKAQTEEARVFISQTAAAVPPGWDPASITDFHHMEMDPKDPNRLWAQAPVGLLRSGDGGRPRAAGRHGTAPGQPARRCTGPCRGPGRRQPSPLDLPQLRTDGRRRLRGRCDPLLDRRRRLGLRDR